MSNQRDAWTAAVTQRAKPNKYGATKKVVEGITFDSVRESKRYQELRFRQQAGEISGLEVQPIFPLYVCRRHGGELHHVCDYIADFRYREGPNGLLIVEDVKSAGTRTPVYRLKRKMFEAQYDMKVIEW